MTVRLDVYFGGMAGAHSRGLAGQAGDAFIRADERETCVIRRIALGAVFGAGTWMLAEMISSAIALGVAAVPSGLLRDRC
jgi:hypothetical protein